MTFNQSTTAKGGEASVSLPGAAGFDLFKLDCIADSLRSGPPLTRDEQHELRRVIENLNDLMETVQ